jgi:uncharacterized protein (DUF58 family)
MRNVVVSRIRARFRRWFESRLPLSDSITLTQRTVYILPTRAGLMLFVTLLVLLVAAINYQLNLGYLLTFLLGGSAVVGMHVCHGTLRGLGLHLLPPQPQFARASAVLDVVLSSQRSSVRHGIGLSVWGLDQWAWNDVPAQGSSTIQVAWQPLQRGWHRVPTLTAETRFPMGTFRVWTVWRPAAQVLVYPAPEAHPPPLPPGQTRTGGAVMQHARDGGEYDGVRAYRRGDPLKQIVWKKAAHTDQLVSREREPQEGEELWLDFDHTGVSAAAPAAAADQTHAPQSVTERKLARLCAWVLQVDRLDLDYGLRLPGKVVAPGSGEAHKRECLEALALC